MCSKCKALDYMHRLTLECDGERPEVIYNMVYTTIYMVVNGNYATYNMIQRISKTFYTLSTDSV